MNFISTPELLKTRIPPWLIYKVLPGSGLSLLYGVPGSGKSFMALDMALCVATGTPWHDTHVNPGQVVYVASEGKEGLVKRALAWMQQHAVEDVSNIRWYLDSLDFRDEDTVGEFLFKLETEFPGRRVHVGDGEFEFVGGLDLRLLVIDTMARNFGGEDENSFEVMEPFIRVLTQFSNDTGALVLLVHHTNALGTRERGHSSLRGAIDVAYEVVADYDQSTNQLKEITLKNNKLKDDARQRFLTFAPRVMSLPLLGKDEEGRGYTSLVLDGKAGQHEQALKAITRLLRAGAVWSQGDLIVALEDRYKHSIIRSAIRQGETDGVLRVERGNEHNRYDICLV